MRSKGSYTPAGPPAGSGRNQIAAPGDDHQGGDDAAGAHGAGYCISRAGSDPIPPSQGWAERRQICERGASRSRWSMVPVRRLKILGPSPSAAVA